MVLTRALYNVKALTRRFSGESLTQKATLNALASALEYGARLVVGFLLNPLLVAGLGSYGYGIWQVLGRLIAYISPASGRPTQALKWTLANQLASTDYHEKRRQVGSAMIVWLLFLPLLALAGGIITWYAPGWLHTSADFTPTVRLAIAILVVDLIMTTLSEIPHSVLQGENLGYKRMGLSALLIFLGGGLTALSLYFKTGLLGVAVAELAATTVTGIFYVQVVRNYISWFGMMLPTTAAIRRFLGLSGWFLVWNLVSQLMRASDVVILGVFASAEMVTVYTLTKYVPETVINVVEIVVLGIAPGLGGVIGRGDLARAVRVRNEIMTYTWLIITIVGATILLWNRSFVNLWVGAQFDAGPLPTLLIVLVVLQFVVIRNDANIIDLTLNLRHKVLAGLASTAIAMGIAALAVGFGHTGIVGLCLGLMVGRALLSFGYPWLIGRFLGVTLAAQLKGSIRPALVLAVLFGLAALLSQHWVVNGWLELIAAVFMTVWVFLPLAFFGGLSSAQREQIIRRVRLMLQPQEGRASR